MENTGEVPVLFHVGDMLTGGKQDRLVARSVVVPAGSGRVTIDTLCVEPGRWGMSGTAGGMFAFAGVKFPHAAQTIPFGQSGTWTAAAAYQKTLQLAVGKSVIDARHPSSLPRTVQKFQALQSAMAFSDVPLDGATGYVAVKNGRVVAAEQFGSAGMLLASWPKLMRSAAVAGVLASSGSGKITSRADVETFLNERAEAGAVTDAIGPDNALLHRVFHVHGTGRKTHPNPYGEALRRYMPSPRLPSPYIIGR